MELYGLTYSKQIRFDVSNVEDYNIVGSFDPNATSDIEYYGYRETTFKVDGVETKDKLTGYYWPINDDEVRYFSEKHNDQLTLIVQNYIDGD